MRGFLKKKISKKNLQDFVQDYKNTNFISKNRFYSFDKTMFSQQKLDHWKYILVCFCSIVYHNLNFCCLETMKLLFYTNFFMINGIMYIAILVFNMLVIWMFREYFRKYPNLFCYWVGWFYNSIIKNNKKCAANVLGNKIKIFYRK